VVGDVAGVVGTIASMVGAAADVDEEVIGACHTHILRTK